MSKVVVLSWRREMRQARRDLDRAVDQARGCMGCAAAMLSMGDIMEYQRIMRRIAASPTKRGCEECRGKDVDKQGG